ncbi:D-alanyl-D-alanine carboxypeptidase [Tissierella creatinini]|nr:D-alanyl-D-alanine carboxypeptidase [Tissierella creatinini]TJX69109.1 D-alanyl-D-alanine carboxypeptidase [Soehngenia saccharolytica]
MKKLICIIIFINLLVGNSVNAANHNLSGQSYVLMEENSGRVLLESNSHQRMPMASTTKIMTALLAIEKGNLEDVVTIDEESIGIEGSSIYLKLGEKVILRELVYGLILRSGNDSAVAIANHISGSLEGFIDEMNNKARALGALDTSFMNPHGLHNDNHYSSAYDLGLITRAAFKSREFCEIFSAKIYKGEREANNYYVNKNKTLWEYNGGDGGKTGYTTRSGRCLVSSASRDNMRLIAVSLNAPNWFNDNYSLLDYGFENYKIYRIYDENQQISITDVIDGEKDKLAVISEEGFYYPLTQKEKKNIKIDIVLDKSIKAPVNKGEVIGYVEVFLNGRLIGKDRIVAGQSIKKKSFFKRIMDNLKDSADNQYLQKHK